MEEIQIPLTLADLSRELEKRGHGKKSVDRLRVYCTRGVDACGVRIRLDSWQINGRRSSTVEAYVRFLRDQMDAQTAEQRSDAPA
jgi:hypothetical protein